MKDTPQIKEFKKSIGNNEMLSRLSVMAMKKFAEDNSEENLKDLINNLDFQIEDALVMIQTAHNIAYQPESPVAIKVSLSGAIRSAMRSDHPKSQDIIQMCGNAIGELYPKEVIQ